VNGGVDWLSAVAILLCGLIVGAMFFYRISSSTRGAAQDLDLERRDLRAKVDDLVARLRETSEDDSDERSRLEQEAAAALRRLSELGGEVQSGAQGPLSKQGPAPVRQSGPLAGFLWGAGSMAAIALLGYYVYASSTPRKDGASVTGDAAPPMAAASAARSAGDPDIQRLRKELQESPNDVEKRLELARRELMVEDLIGVLQDTELVLKQDPENAVALTYQAFVKMAMGQDDAALSMLNRALAKDPSLIDAWVQLALVNTRMGRNEEAERAIDEAVKRRPDQEAALRALLTQMRSGENGGSQQAPAAPAAATQASNPQESVGGVIMVPSGVSPSAALFVIARASGVTSGPPVAAAKLPITPGRVPFELSAANSMMGQGLPPHLRIEARIDSDGNAMTHEASDLTAVAEGVVLGKHDLVLAPK
jgi:tetratricopeptide (TPR) repeat protein